MKDGRYQCNLFLTLPSWLSLVDRDAPSTSAAPAPEFGSLVSTPVASGPSSPPSASSPTYAPPSPLEVKPEPEYEPSDPVRLLHPIVLEHVERR
jgi:hypothetical protein